MNTKRVLFVVVIQVAIIGCVTAASHANVIENTQNCIFETEAASLVKTDFLFEILSNHEMIVLAEKTDKHLKGELASPSSPISMARLFVKKKNFSKAIASYEQAIDSEKDLNEKANYYYELALVIYDQKDYPRVRDLAIEAINLRPGWGKPYILIGNIYASSANLIGESDLQQRIVYCLAVDQFINAKAIDPAVSSEANEDIGKYSQFFPNKEDALFENIKAGSIYKIGGWINESTTVRLR